MEEEQKWEYFTEDVTCNELLLSEFAASYVEVDNNVAIINGEEHDFSFLGFIAGYVTACIHVDFTKGTLLEEPDRELYAITGSGSQVIIFPTARIRRVERETLEKMIAEREAKSKIIVPEKKISVVGKDGFR